MGQLLIAGPVQRGKGAGGDLLGGDVLVDDLVDEGRIRPVFQQAAHQIGQQVAMRADGGVDPAAGALAFQHDVMQRLTHAMQTLEFKGLMRQVAGHLQHGGHGMGVVGGELRIDSVGQRQQAAGQGDVADIAGFLAGEDGEVFQPLDLRQLDFAVPVGAFDQTHHDAAVVGFGHLVQRLDHVTGAAAIGLDDDAETLPSGQLGIGQRGLDHLERQGQAVGLFRVDVQPDAGGGGLTAEVGQNGHQFGHDARGLGDLVARMQRRQLDRDPGVRPHVRALGGTGDGGDGIGIGAGIAIGIGAGHRRFTQHVIRIGEAFGFLAFRPIHRGLDRLAQHELSAHLADRGPDGIADHRFTHAAHHGPQGAGHAGFLLLKHAAGQHQPPGRGIDQRRGRMPKVRGPVRRRDLVFDQCVDGGGVRHAQQRLGQAHQRHAFLGREAVFGQEDFHQPGVRGLADLFDQGGGAGDDGGAGRAIQVGQGDQVGQKRGFIAVFVAVPGGVDVDHGVSPGVGTRIQGFAWAVFLQCCDQRPFGLNFGPILGKMIHERRAA